MENGEQTANLLIWPVEGRGGGISFHESGARASGKMIVPRRTAEPVSLGPYPDMDPAMTRYSDKITPALLKSEPFPLTRKKMAC